MKIITVQEVITRTSNSGKMKFQNGLILLKGMYFNYYIYLIWTLCNGLLLYSKMDYMKIPRLLVVTAYITMIITFCIKLTLVHRRHFTSDISKLTQFFLLTGLIQIPLVSFFLISFPLLLCTPVEIILHSLLLITTLIEGSISFLSVYRTVKHTANQCPPRAPYSHFPPIELQPHVYGNPTEVTRPRRI